jgi:hypothetical protein
MPTYNQAQVDNAVRLATEGVYGEIYLHEGSTAQSIATGATYTKVDGFMSDGVSSNCTNDVANDKITVTEDGNYKVECSLSFTGSGTNEIWLGSVFLEGVEQDKIHFERKISIGGDIGSTQFGGIVTASAGDDLDIRVRHGDGGAIDFTPSYMNFNVVRVG